MVQKNFGPTKIWGLKICFVKKTYVLEKILGQHFFGKIGSVTAEILLKWTNVARTYVAWTNVTLTVGIC